MKSRIAIAAIVPAVLALALCVIGCSGTAPQQSDAEQLIGVWENTDSSDDFVAFDGETCSTPSVAGQYEVKEDKKRIWVEFPNQTMSLAYEIDGDTLTITINGESYTYARSSNSADDAKAKQPREIAFDGAVLLDNEYTTIELVRFYEDGSSGVTKACFDLKVTNKTSNEGIIDFDLYLGDEKASVWMSGNGAPAPGKSQRMEYSLDPEESPVESLDDLYTLNGTANWDVVSDSYVVESKEFPISFEGASEHVRTWIGNATGPLS